MENSLLYYFLDEPLKNYSNDFFLLDSKNPVLFSLNGKTYSAHISYVHDAGNGRTNEDEARIQLRRSVIDLQRERQKKGVDPLFIGFFNNGEAFAGWSAAHVFSLKAQNMVSIYTRKSHYEKALEQGGICRVFHSNNLGINTNEVSFPINVLGFYVENSVELHKIAELNEFREVINSSSEILEVENDNVFDEIEILDMGAREKVVFTIKRVAYKRTKSFSNSVIAAYDATCAVCGRQLNLIQAAHIVPHCHPKGNDLVTNGIALCVEHHALYDKAILLPNYDGKLHLNESKIEFLSAIGQAKGVESLQVFNNRNFETPKNENHHPKKEFLQLGFEIRTGRTD